MGKIIMGLKLRDIRDGIFVRYSIEHDFSLGLAS